MHLCIGEYPESGVKSYSHIDLIYDLIKKANPPKADKYRTLNFESSSGGQVLKEGILSIG